VRNFFCVFLAENSFVNAVIPFIGIKDKFIFIRSLTLALKAGYELAA